MATPLRRIVIAAGVVGLGMVFVKIAMSGSADHQDRGAAPTARAADPAVAARARAPAQDAVAAPATAAPPHPAAALAPAPASTPSAVVDPIGTVQGVPADLNPQVASVASALTQRDHPERLSALVAPPAFDAQAYAADPQGYANEVVPGRALQSAAPGPDVPVLVPLVATQLTIAQDQEAILRVRTQPGGAITFTSFDLGRFGNSLVSQTVIADANGVGSVSFTAGPGTIDAVHILAASPTASGQVAFDVMVTPHG